MNDNAKPQFDFGGTDWLSLIWRRRKLFLIPFVLVTAAGLAVGTLLPKGYESKTVTKVLDSSFLSSVYRGLSVARPSVEFTAAEYEIKRKEDLESILREEGFLADQASLAAREETIDAIRDKIKVEVATPQQGRGDKLLKISVLARSPHQAQTLVTRVTENYINRLMRRYRSSVYDMRNKAIVEHERAQTQYDEAEEALREFEEEHQDALSIGENRSNIEREIEKADEQIQEWVTQLDELDAEVNALDQQLANLEPETVVKDQVVNPEWERLMALRSLVLNELAAHPDKLDSHPAVRELKSKLAEIEQILAVTRRFDRNVEKRTPNPEWSRVNLEYSKLSQKQASLQRKLATRQKKLKQWRERFKKLPEINAQRQRYVDQLGNHRENLDRFAELRWHADVAWKRVVAALDDLFIPIENASKPLKHSTPPPAMILLISLGLGVALGLGLVFLVEMSRKTFFSPEDVTAMLSLPVLGMVHTILSPIEAEQRRRKRAAAILATLLLALGALTVLYVYNRNPSLLPPVVVDSVQRMKDLVS